MSHMRDWNLITLLINNLIRVIQTSMWSKVLWSGNRKSLRIFQIKEISWVLLKRVNKMIRRHPQNSPLCLPPIKPKYKYHKPSKTTKSSSSLVKDLLVRSFLSSPAIKLNMPLKLFISKQPYSIKKSENKPKSCFLLNIQTLWTPNISSNTITNHRLRSSLNTVRMVIWGIFLENSLPKKSLKSNLKSTKDSDTYTTKE